MEEFNAGRECQWRSALVYMQNMYRHYDAISLFRECRAMILLPHALYCIIAGYLHWDDMKVPGDPVPPLTDSMLILYKKPTTLDLVAIFTGREYTTRAFREEVNKILLQEVPAQCTDGCAARLKLKMAESAVWPSTLIWWDLMCLEFCSNCRTAMGQSMTDSASLIWNRLPKYFGLDDWDVLRSSTE